MATNNMAARIVGWASKSEWIQIYQELFSEDPVQVQHALGRAAAWKGRLDTKMPIAIDCTTSLLTVRVRDSGAHVRGEGGERRRASHDSHDLFQLRLAYSMALARFVNLVTDAGQDKFYIQPVHVMAKEVALPEWMVNLRHEATHRSLPALPVLRSGAQFALSWLRQKYWEPQLQQCGQLPGGAAQQEGLDDEEVRQAVAGLLISYEKHQFEILSESTPRKQRAHHTGLLQELLNNLAALMSKNSGHVVECLCRQGFLLPTLEQRTALGITNGCLDKAALPSIDKKFQDFWKPVFELLHQSNSIPQLLERLVQQLGTYTDDNLDFAVGWIALIITAKDSKAFGLQPLTDRNELYQQNLSQNLLRDKKSLERVLHKVKGQLPWKQLISCCLATPCKHSTSLVHSMLQEAEPPFSKFEQETYQHLWTIYSGNTSQTDQPGPDTVFTADMVRHRIQERCTRAQEGVTSTQEDAMECSEERTHHQYKAWEKCTDEINWGQFPLGCIPKHLDDVNYLEVALDDNQGSGTRATHRKQEMHDMGRIWAQDSQEEAASPIPVEEEVHQRNYWTPMELGMLKRRVVLF